MDLVKLHNHQPKTASFYFRVNCWRRGD